MKGLIYVAVILMIGLMFISCTGTTATQRKEAPVVGLSSTQAEDVNGVFSN